MSASELNRVLFELNQVNPKLAARAEEASVVAVCFAHFEGCSEEVLLATRASEIGKFIPGANSPLADPAALEATRSISAVEAGSDAARQVLELVHPLNLSGSDYTAG